MIGAVRKPLRLVTQAMLPFAGKVNLQQLCPVILSADRIFHDVMSRTVFPFEACRFVRLLNARVQEAELCCQRWKICAARISQVSDLLWKVAAARLDTTRY